MNNPPNTSSSDSSDGSDARSALSRTSSRTKSPRKPPKEKNESACTSMKSGTSIKSPKRSSRKSSKSRSRSRSKSRRKSKSLPSKPGSKSPKRSSSKPGSKSPRRSSSKPGSKSPKRSSSKPGSKSPRRSSSKPGSKSPKKSSSKPGSKSPRRSSSKPGSKSPKRSSSKPGSKSPKRSSKRSPSRSKSRSRRNSLKKEMKSETSKFRPPLTPSTLANNANKTIATQGRNNFAKYWLLPHRDKISQLYYPSRVDVLKTEFELYQRGYAIRDLDLSSDRFGLVLFASKKGLDKPMVVKIKHLNQMPQLHQKRYMDHSLPLLKALCQTYDNFHSSLIRIYGVYVDVNRSYVFMERIDPVVTLQTKIEVKKTFRLEEKLFVAREIAEGLNYLHCSGIAHMNVKTDNFIFDRDSHIRLTGLSRLYLFWAEKKKKERLYPKVFKQIFLNKGYYPPEVHHTNFDPTAVDVFSFGIVICLLFLRRNPNHKGSLHPDNQNIDKMWAAFSRRHKHQLSDLPRSLVELLNAIFKHRASKRIRMPEVIAPQYFSDARKPNIHGPDQPGLVKQQISASFDSSDASVGSGADSKLAVSQVISTSHVRPKPLVTSKPDSKQESPNPFGKPLTTSNPNNAFSNPNESFYDKPFEWTIEHARRVHDDPGKPSLNYASRILPGMTNALQQSDTEDSIKNTSRDLISVFKTKNSKGSKNDDKDNSTTDQDFDDDHDSIISIGSEEDDTDDGSDSKPPLQTKTSHQIMELLKGQAVKPGSQQTKAGDNSVKKTPVTTQKPPRAPQQKPQPAKPKPQETSPTTKPKPAAQKQQQKSKSSKPAAQKPKKRSKTDKVKPTVQMSQEKSKTDKPKPAVQKPQDRSKTNKPKPTARKPQDRSKTAKSKPVATKLIPTSQTKSTPTPETKLTPTPETKLTPTPETKPTPTPETKPTPTPETKPTPTPKTKPTPTPKTKPTPTPKTKPTPTPKTKPTPTPEQPQQDKTSKPESPSTGPVGTLFSWPTIFHPGKSSLIFVTPKDHHDLSVMKESVFKIRSYIRTRRSPKNPKLSVKEVSEHLIESKETQVHYSIPEQEANDLTYQIGKYMKLVDPSANPDQSSKPSTSQPATPNPTPIVGEAKSAFQSIQTQDSPKPANQKKPKSAPVQSRRPSLRTARTQPEMRKKVANSTKPQRSQSLQNMPPQSDLKDKKGRINLREAVVDYKKTKTEKIQQSESE